jgi:hypothetical protein
MNFINRIKSVFLPTPENDFQALVLKSDFLFRLLLVFFILRIVVFPFYAYFPKSIFFAKVTSSDIFELLNGQRETQGLVSLTENSKLQKAAIMKAQHMIDQNYFGHKSPGGISGWYWIQKAGYDYQIAGENLAIGFLDSGEVHQAWNNSPLHKENLLSPKFEDVGIAVLTGEFQERETTVVVQFFGKKKSAVAGELVVSPETEVEEEPQLPPKELPGEPEETVREEEPEEEIVLEVSPEVNPEVAPAISPEVEEPSIQLAFWKFLTKNYGSLLEKSIFIGAFLLTIILILNVIVIIASSLSFGRKKVFLRKVVPVGALAIFLLVFLGLFGKSFIIQTIPHQLEI